MAPKFSYNEESMKKALFAVENEGMSKRCAAKTFKVPRTTLADKLAGRTPRGRRMGHLPFLTELEERDLVNWIRDGNRRGLPPHKNDVLNTVQRIIRSTPERKTPFKDQRPGETWWKAFMERHQELAIRIPERVSKARAGVNEVSIRLWFTELLKNMEDLNLMNIFNEPKRVYNCDETNIQLAPGTGKVVGIKGNKNTYEVAPGPEKSNLTLVGTFCANGDIVKPVIIYPYVRIPKDIIDMIPSNITAARTDSGWMNSQAFYEYIVNVFDPYLEEQKIEKPVILFIDGHSSHLTMQLSVKCEEIGIIIYILPPNTTHILQPADVGPFKPFKTYWKQAIHNFQRKNPNQVVRRKNVAPLVDEVLNKVTRDSIINGFRVCGLFPLNPDAVDYSKCLDVDFVEEDVQEDTPGPSTRTTCSTEEYITAMKVIKSELGEAKSNLCYNRVNLDVQDLYDLYGRILHNASKNIATSINASGNQTNETNIVNVIDFGDDPNLEIVQTHQDNYLPDINNIGLQPAEVNQPILYISDIADLGIIEVSTLQEQGSVPQEQKIDNLEHVNSEDIIHQAKDIEQHAMNSDPHQSIRIECCQDINSSVTAVHDGLREKSPMLSLSATVSEDSSLLKTLHEPEQSLTAEETPSTSTNSVQSITESVSTISSIITENPNLEQVKSSHDSMKTPPYVPPVNDSFVDDDRTGYPPLERSNAFIQTKKECVSYHSKVPKDYIFFDGKIEYKKRKAPETPQPSMLVSTEYRKFLIEKKGKKKKSNDWLCLYCNVSYTDDVNGNKNKKWINCDSCSRQMHTSCIPKKHKETVSYDSEDSSDEIAFICEFCLT